ncbi:unnamed protein product [Durusdinium trenchii]|uniref:Uncharacterized protein n=1 Tax=Durusdinium trenchii TaxID=1381693 RepID=A0ABP0K4M8_9DINO
MPALNIHTVAGGSDLEGPVVRNNFPEEVLKRLKIVNTKRNELVNEFWYDEKQCFYSQSRIEDLEGAHKYARIIGLDSNQSDLSSEILSASLMVAGVTSQLAFVADVWNQEVPAYQADKKKFRAVYTAVFFSGIGMQFLTTLYTTIYQMRSSRFQADAWIGNWCEWFFSCGKLLVLNLLGVVSTLKGLPIILHPRKGVQPFAAFKAKGRRMFAVGWPNKVMYNWERDRSKKMGHVRVIMCALPLFLLQVFLGEGMKSMSYMAFLSGALTLFQVVRSIYSFVKIIYHECLAKQYLRMMTDDKLQNELDFLEKNTEAKRELIVNYRLREEHFNETIPEQVQKWVRTEKMAGATDDGSNIICCHLTCDDDDLEDTDSDSDFSDDALLCTSPKFKRRR